MSRTNEGLGKITDKIIDLLAEENISTLEKFKIVKSLYVSFMQTCKESGIVITESGIVASDKTLDVKVVTLIGSSKMRETWDNVNSYLTRLGYAVFSLGVWSAPDKEKIRPILERVHDKKIELADIVAVILKPDATIGINASNELKYARQLGKKIIGFNYEGKKIPEDWIA